MQRLPDFVWRMMRLPRIWYALGLGPVVGRLFLLLTTIGRKSGLPRVTPLQYERENGQFYVASARGSKADWYRNLLANPQVKVQVRNDRFSGSAVPITEPKRIADFLELRLRRHPRMVGAMLRLEGLPANPHRVQLERLAKKITLVAIHPCETGDTP